MIQRLSEVLIQLGLGECCHSLWKTDSLKRVLLPT